MLSAAPPIDVVRRARNSQRQFAPSLCPARVSKLLKEYRRNSRSVTAILRCDYFGSPRKSPIV